MYKRQGPHRIDLAVGHPDVPGRYLVAVTSDGPRYAALPGTRFRERLRPEQLARCGWAWVPVWSTDVYRDPAREVARIVAEVRARMREVVTTAVIHHAEMAKAASGEGLEEPHVETAIAAASEQATELGEQSAEHATELGEQTDPAEGEAVSDESTPAETARPQIKPGVEQTRDDTDAGWGERSDESAHDRWLQEQRPPHWE